MVELDGAGILFDIPHDFLKKYMILNFQIQKNMLLEWFFYKRAAIKLFFLSETTFENAIHGKSRILGWRVPVDASNLGQCWRKKEPTVKQASLCSR
jgi:glutamate synthase (ferredoxin)